MKTGTPARRPLPAARWPECKYELETLEAVMAGRPADDHECADCAEIRQVAGAVLNDYRAAVSEANVPPAGAVFWRIQKRARRETLDRAARAITMLQAFSVSAAAAITLTILGVTRETWKVWLARLTDGLHFGAIEIPAAFGFVVLAAAATLFIAPIAAWLAVRE